MYWPETPPQVHWDADYAVRTRWGGSVAPPDFNPFAWPITGGPEAVQHAVDTAGTAGMAGWYDAEA